jgi:hypothetical protein
MCSTKRHGFNKASCLALHAVQQDGNVRPISGRAFGRRERKCGHEHDDPAANQCQAKTIHGLPTASPRWRFPPFLQPAPARKAVHFWTFARASSAHSAGMENLREKLEKLRADADDCSAISRLTNDMTKRKLFARLAAQLRKMADDVEVEIANRLAGEETQVRGSYLFHAD